MVEPVTYKQYCGTDLQMGAVVVDYPREHPGFHQSPVEEGGKPRLLRLSHRRKEDES